MSVKEDWKETGKELGKAFKSFGSTYVRSAETTADKVEKWVETPDGESMPKSEEPTVYSDGSWRETGKQVGSALKSLGKSLAKSAKEGIDMLDEEIKG